MCLLFSDRFPLTLYLSHEGMSSYQQGPDAMAGAGDDQDGGDFADEDEEEDQEHH